MENIFENARFGKSYRTRDGRRAVYNYHSIGGYHDIIIDGEGSSYHFADHTNGILRLPLPSEIKPDVDYSCPVDIVSEWTEPIDEEELDELAEQWVHNHATYPDARDRKTIIKEAYKASCKETFKRFS